MMMRALILITALMMSGAPSYAEEIEQDKSAEQNTPTATQSWLELQRSKQAASGQAQPISGKALDKIHERYINSFGKPIPEFYKHETPATK